MTALLLLCTAVSFTQGPNTTLSTAQAANFGLQFALGFLVAVPVGWGLLRSLCPSGVGPLVVSFPPLRLGVKFCGVGTFSGSLLSCGMPTNWHRLTASSSASHFGKG